MAGGDLAADLYELALVSWVETLVQQIAGIFLRLPSVAQRHVGVGAEGQQLLLPTEPIGQTPEARPVRIHENEKTLKVSELPGLGVRLEGTELGVGQRHSCWYRRPTCWYQALFVPTMFTVSHGTPRNAHAAQNRHFA